MKAIAKRVLFVGARKEVREIYENAALCIDISGFTFGDKKGYKLCESYLDRLDLLRSLDVPYYLMPQSFGPFRFEGSQLKTVEVRAARILPAARIVFPREHDGLESLMELCPDANYVCSDDLVLQCGDSDLGAVFKDPPSPCTHLPRLGGRTAGIVPNQRVYDNGNAAVIDGLYERVLSRLLDSGYEVALIRHASEDLAICERVKAAFSGDERVQVYGEDRYCFEYGNLFTRCEFLVASRYHSIVHAYKCGVPCIALGWAVKYQELLSLVGQEALVFDATDSQLDFVEVLGAVDFVSEHRDELSRQIEAAVVRIQEKNVFDLVEADFRSMGRSEVS